MLNLICDEFHFHSDVHNNVLYKQGVCTLLFAENCGIIVLGSIPPHPQGVGFPLTNIMKSYLLREYLGGYRDCTP